VSTSASLTDRDLRALVALLDDARADEPGPAMPWTVMDGLMNLVPCKEVGFCELDLPHRGRPVGQCVLDGGERDFESGDAYDPTPDEAYWTLSPGFRGCAEPEYPGQLLHLSEIYSPRELRRQPLFAEVFAPWGVKYLMSIALRSRPGHPRRLLFWRNSGPDFSDREKLLMKLLWPHLEEVYWEAERRRQGTPRLTPREWQVLDLVAQGHGNAEIARMLVTSVSTVRKHLENIFERTGVHSRSAAVALIMPWAAIGAVRSGIPPTLRSIPFHQATGNDVGTPA